MAALCIKWRHNQKNFWRPPLINCFRRHWKTGRKLCGNNITHSIHCPKVVNASCAHVANHAAKALAMASMNRAADVQLTARLRQTGLAVVNGQPANRHNQNFNRWSAVRGQCASPCQISLNSVKRLHRYGNLTVSFKMAAVRHLGFVWRVLWTPMTTELE